MQALIFRRTGHLVLCELCAQQIHAAGEAWKSASWASKKDRFAQCLGCQLCPSLSQPQEIWCSADVTVSTARCFFAPKSQVNLKPTSAWPVKIEATVLLLLCAPFLRNDRVRIQFMYVNDCWCIYSIFGYLDSFWDKGRLKYLPNALPGRSWWLKLEDFRQTKPMSKRMSCLP